MSSEILARGPSWILDLDFSVALTTENVINSGAVSLSGVFENSDQKEMIEITEGPLSVKHREKRSKQEHDGDTGYMVPEVMVGW